MLWADALASASSERLGIQPDLPRTTQVDLVPRKMHDSYSELVLPFGSSKEVFENYVNAWGGIRTGKYACRRPLCMDLVLTWRASLQADGTPRLSCWFHCV